MAIPNRLTDILIATVLCIFSATVLAATGERWQLTAEEWSRPRSGEVIVEMPGIRQVVSAWMESPTATIVITYPGGETGLLWAQEIFSWLVALGVPGENLLTRSGSPREDVVILDLLVDFQ